MVDFPLVFFVRFQGKMYPMYQFIQKPQGCQLAKPKISPKPLKQWKIQISKSVKMDETSEFVTDLETKIPTFANFFKPKRPDEKTLYPGIHHQDGIGRFRWPSGQCFDTWHPGVYPPCESNHLKMDGLEMVGR